MHTLTVNHWTVNENGKIVPVNHDAPKMQPGDIVTGPERGKLYRIYLSTYGKLRWDCIAALS